MKPNAAFVITSLTLLTWALLFLVFAGDWQPYGDQQEGYVPLQINIESR